MNMNHNQPAKTEEVLSRRDYQEILLARMAGGDLYANEERMRIRRIDMALDKLREVPLYTACEDSDGFTTICRRKLLSLQ